MVNIYTILARMILVGGLLLRVERLFTSSLIYGRHRLYAFLWGCQIVRKIGYVLAPYRKSIKVCRGYKSYVKICVLQLGNFNSCGSYILLVLEYGFLKDRLSYTKALTMRVITIDNTRQRGTCTYLDRENDVN